METPVLSESSWNAPRQNMARCLAIMPELKQNRRAILDTLLFPVAGAVAGNLGQMSSIAFLRREELSGDDVILLVGPGPATVGTAGVGW